MALADAVSEFNLALPQIRISTIQRCNCNCSLLTQSMHGKSPPLCSLPSWHAAAAVVVVVFNNALPRLYNYLHPADCCSARAAHHCSAVGASAPPVQVVAQHSDNTLLRFWLLSTGTTKEGRIVLQIWEFCCNINKVSVCVNS